MYRSILSFLLFVEILDNFFFHDSTGLVGQGLLIFETSRSYSDSPQSVGLLCTSDRPAAETSTRQHTTLTRDRLACPPVGFEPAITASERPQTARPLGSAVQDNSQFQFLSDRSN
jgi:hypothetical protein